MTGSLNRLLSTAILILVCTAASAQLAPHDISRPPENTATGQDDQESAVYTEKPEPSVQEQPLGRLPIDGFGTLEEKNGGLPATIWNGSSRDRLDFPMEQINTGIANDTLRNLLTKLLMTEATPPQGQSEINWLALRVSVLLNMGQDNKVREIIAALPPSIASQHMLQLQAELELAHGEYDKACNEPHPDTTKLDAKSARFWQKLNIMCQAYRGKHDEAALGLDVLNETNSSIPLFVEEIHRVNDRNYPTTALPRTLSLFDFGLIRMAKDMDRLKDHLDSLPNIAVKYLGEDEEADIKLREKATTRSRQLGLVSDADADKAQQQPFSPALTGDVTTLVNALGSGNPPGDADNTIIEHLTLDDINTQDSRRIERLLSLMQIFGYKVPEPVWAKLFSNRNRYDGEVPPALWLDALYQASQGNRKGEVVVLSALMLGTVNADKTSDLVLLTVINALKIAGFEKEAREIAYAAAKND